MQVQQRGNGRSCTYGLGKRSGRKLADRASRNVRCPEGGRTVERVPRVANRRAPADRQTAVAGADLSAAIPRRGSPFRCEAALPASNLDPLDLIERDRIAGAVVELGRARAFVRRHVLRVFERPAAFEVGGDPGCSKCMAPDPYLQTS